MEEGWQVEREELGARVGHVEAQAEEREREREEERQRERERMREMEEQVLQLQERQAELVEDNTSEGNDTCVHSSNVCSHVHLLLNAEVE